MLGKGHKSVYRVLEKKNDERWNISGWSEEMMFELGFEGECVFQMETDGKGTLDREVSMENLGGLAVRKLKGNHFIQLEI
jgi:hypothetical protein